MQNSQTLLGKIVEVAKFPFAYLSNGAHAQQTLPSQHRLRSAAGMFAGWWLGDKLRDYLFGITQKSEGEYVEIPREDIPLPLRFLHKTIDWDPHSDDPKEQYKKILYQCIPMVTAGVGTVLGSTSAFGPKGPLSEQLGANGREGMFNKRLGLDKMGLLEADMVAQYSQARSFRWLTAMFGGFAAVSMLNVVYGAFLNTAFAIANGARIWGFGGKVMDNLSMKMGNMGPERALDGLITSMPAYFKSLDGGNEEALHRFAELLYLRVISPMFPNIKNAQKEEAIVKSIQEWVEHTYKDVYKNGQIEPDKLAAALKADIEKHVGNNNLAKSLAELGINTKEARLGGAIPFARWLNKILSKVGLAHDPDSFVGRVEHYQPAAVGVGVGA